MESGFKHKHIQPYYIKHKGHDEKKMIANLKKVLIVRQN